MRGAVVDLPTPHPLAGTLPGLYQGEGLTERFCAALDSVLAPVLCVLDNLPAYFDVSTTPEDLLPWLARWLGIELDGGQSPDRQRELLEHASRLHGIQGTARGIELAVEAVFGVEATVQETGASAWSLDPTAPLPGQPQQAFVVTVRTGEGQVLDDRRVDALVAAMKPAHVVHRVTVQS